jgi:hypothetical protein
MFILRSYLATGFQTYKKQSIIHATLSTYQSQCKPVSGVKGSKRKILKFLIQALWDVALFQLIKGNYPQENNFLHPWDRTVEE